MSRMNIAFCAAECAPFAKIGGLGDVVGSLPNALQSLGERVAICIPYYKSIAEEAYPVTFTGVEFTVPWAGQEYRFSIHETTLPGNSVVVYFFDNTELFRNHDSVYMADDPDFGAYRLDVFCQAVLEGLKLLNFKPDIIHVHDWHTSMLAKWFVENRDSDSFYENTRSVLTIHNMAYQGVTDDLNRLETGLRYADALVAVSPTYAREIRTPEYGFGLDQLLISRQENLSGILNGIDVNLFDPSTDAFLPSRYNVDNYQTGKASAKEAVQIAMQLPADPGVPLFGIVTRLVEQKGIDLMLEAMDAFGGMHAQFAFLGSGDSHYEDALRKASQGRSNIRTIVGYHLALAQQIYAGSDVFLMPSHFEPCGIGQLIALRYGSVPLVRRTGGLGDTVLEDITQPDGHHDHWGGNGFVFDQYTAEDFLKAVRRASDCWHDQPGVWAQLVRNGMNSDFSWTKSAQAYQRVYHSLVADLIHSH